MKKALVVGSTGFIGRNFLKHLGDLLNADMFKGDITKKEDLPDEKYDIVFHFAAKIPHKNIEDDGVFYEVNVNGTRNLLEKYSDAKMVYLSTIDVEREVLNEYSKSKLYAEKLVLANPRNMVIRLPSVFGADMVQDKLTKKLIADYKTVTLNNDEERNHVHIDHVINYICDYLSSSGLHVIYGTSIKNSELVALFKYCKEEPKFVRSIMEVV